MTELDFVMKRAMDGDFDGIESLSEARDAWREAYLAHKAYRSNNNGHNARRNRAATDKLKELKLK